MTPADFQSVGRATRLPAGRLMLVMSLVLAVVLGSRGLGDEGAVSMGGDMPRYLMNGVFLLDFAGSGAATGITNAISFAQHYYAQYPALSLGHHPPLLPIALVPAFALLGPSVMAGRITILLFHLAAILLLYRLTRRRFNDVTAGWACLLFSTHPYVTSFSQSVLSEVPMITLVLAALNALDDFRWNGHVRAYWLFVLAATASLSAKQLGVFMFPAYAVMLVAGDGRVHITQRSVMVWTIAGALMFSVLALGTLWLSPFNVSVVTAVMGRRLGLEAFDDVLIAIVQEQLGLALLLATSAGIVAALWTRDRRILPNLLWMVAVLAGVIIVTGPVEPARYSIVALPAYCVCAASLATLRVRRGPAVGTAVLLVACVWQMTIAAQVTPVGGGGYESAARFVVSQTPTTGQTPPVLFSGPVDTGYFIFFVRKHDPAGQIVVLRSDKLFTTSRMAELSVEDRIGSPAEIYDNLRTYGVRFVVIEDIPTGSQVLDWLRDEVKTDRFSERLRIPIASRDRRLRTRELIVYEYRNATSAQEGAVLDINLPLIGQGVRIQLSEIARGRRPAGLRPAGSDGLTPPPRTP